MHTGTGDEVVRNVAVKKRFVQLFIDLIKEILCSAIDDKFK